MPATAEKVLEGINFLTNNQGERTAVVIDLKKYGDYLEDFFDIIESRERMKENDTISLADFKAKLRAEGRNIGDV